MADEITKGSPKKARGRPKGTFKDKPDVTQRADNATMLDQLLELSPMPSQDSLTKRLSPAAWHAKRERLLLEILAEWPEQAEGFLKELQANPGRYTPQQLEAF